MSRTNTILTLALAFCLVLAFTGSAKADMSGQWTHYVDWVAPALHGSWTFNLTVITPEYLYIDGDRVVVEVSPAVTVYVSLSSPYAYVGLNHGESDTAIGGFMDQPSNQNYGSFHSVRGLPAIAVSGAGAETGE